MRRLDRALVRGDHERVVSQTSNEPAIAGPAAAPSELGLVRARIRDGSLLHGAHLALALLLVLWTAIERTPALSSASGATWITTPLGRGAVLASELVAVVSLALVLVASWRTRRAWRTWVLLLAFAASLAWRREIDVFDLVYVALALALCVWWFREERPALVERALEL